MDKNSLHNTSLFIILTGLICGCQQQIKLARVDVQTGSYKNLSCVEHADIRTLSGTSLSPMLLPDDQLLFLGGYYKCNSIKKGDLVLYRWGDKKNVAKFVRGMAGDILTVKEISPDQWRLELNGQPLYNSTGAEYVLSEEKAALIRLYARKIEVNEVLLLGNKSNGSHDSTVFGLVNTSQLSGKLIPITHSSSQ